MITVIAAEPVTTVSSPSLYRPGFPGVERSVLPQAAPAASPAPDAGSQRFGQAGSQGQNKPPPAAPAEPPRPAATMFAAAVIAGALSRRPRSVSEVYLRIGIAPIPTDSEARLKDLTA